VGSIELMEEGTGASWKLFGWEQEYTSWTKLVHRGMRMARDPSVDGQSTTIHPTPHLLRTVSEQPSNTPTTATTSSSQGLLPPHTVMQTPTSFKARATLTPGVPSTPSSPTKRTVQGTRPQSSLSSRLNGLIGSPLKGSRSMPRIKVDARILTGGRDEERSDEGVDMEIRRPGSSRDLRRGLGVGVGAGVSNGNGGDGKDKVTVCVRYVSVCHYYRHTSASESDCNPHIGVRYVEQDHPLQPRNRNHHLNTILYLHLWVR
jgi:hypothetical protein